jgi:lipopolysaccharide/colanic/teichoic acid biosynthesis glycosyltransferase
MLDMAVAFLLLLPSAVLLLPFVVVLLLKKRQAFRWETRCGHYGVPFQMLRLNVDRPAPPACSFDRFLEHLSITELPQLWNVLRGQMSLVGPRPDPAQRLSEYSKWQQHRLKVKPGMTGLAQVHGLRESSSPEQKTRFDLQYAINPYLLWDISILLQTVWTLARRALLPKAAAGTFDVRWASELPQEVISNAHRTQPSAD